MSQTPSARQSQYPVDKLFVERWSPRAFTGETIPQAQLLTILEAGRWAPSSYNAQPWRFIYALPGTPAWQALFGTLIEFNQQWTAKASALVLLVSANESAPYGGPSQPNPSHSLDAGAAWANVALQAHLSGWAAHGMTGFDKEAARTAFAVPDGFTIEQVFAIGRRSDDVSGLPESVRGAETPNQRKPLEEIVAEGRFNFQA